MIFSILSLALFIWAILTTNEILASNALLPHLALMLGIVGTTSLVITPLMNAIFLIPFQKAEQNLAPFLIKSVRQDKFFAWGNTFLLLFAFISYIFIIVLFSFDHISKTKLIGTWILLLGMTLDILGAIIKRSMGYLDPFKLVDRFTQSAKDAIKNNQDAETWQWMDALADISMAGIEKNSSTLLTQSLNALLRVFKTFLETCKSLSHPSQIAAGGRDEESYTVFYVVNRLEMIYSKALSKRVELFCSQIIATLGKITVSSAKFDISLATFPCQILGKLANKAQEQSLDDVAIKASGVLLEVAKAILTEIDITYMELKDPFIAIVCSLENIAKMTFRKDKTINIQILIEPLTALLNIIQNEKYASHPDTPTIIAEINRVLGEFATLEQVLRTMPPIPKMEAPKPI